MKRIITLSFLLLCGLSITLNAQQVAKSVYEKVLLKGATVHTVTKGNLLNTDVLINNGKIAAVGQNLKVDGDEKIIDCTGKHVYPGFIDGGTQLGLSEVSSVSLTNDFREIGNFIPHMQALTAVNPNATAIPVTRVNGITSVIAAPKGGSFPGTAALIDLHGYTPDQMYAGFKGVVMNFPSSGKRGRWDRRSDEDIEKANKKANEEINEIWEQLTTYAKIDSALKAGSTTSIREYMPEYEALLPVYRGEAVLMVEVNKDDDIEAAIKWIAKKNIKKAVLTGVDEGWRVADKIAAAKLPVITGPVLSIPGRGYVRYDANYTNANKLLKAGVKVALRTDGSENVRNLPFEAGFAAAYGMGVEEALKAITIVPAEIFGVADKYGSIEVGKVANMFVSTGDPFEMQSAIEHLFIKGWTVPIESRHTLLYNEFLHRSPGK
jgi:imidazolonepropionase-like amidohydrolase